MSKQKQKQKQSDESEDEVIVVPQDFNPTYLWEDRIYTQITRCHCPYEDIRARVSELEVPGIDEQMEREEISSLIRMAAHRETKNTFFSQRMRILGFDEETNLLFFWIAQEPSENGSVNSTFKVGNTFPLHHIYDEPEIYEPEEEPEQTNRAKAEEALREEQKR